LILEGAARRTDRPLTGLKRPRRDGPLAATGPRGGDDRSGRLERPPDPEYESPSWRAFFQASPTRSRQRVTARRANQARSKVEGMSPGSPNQRLRPFRPIRFGRYTLLMPVSTGGMGELFLARLEGAHGFDKPCIIKKILSHLAEDPDFVERFVNEARILVQLSHGNIAQVLDMGVHEGAPYIALEFVDGKDLRKVLSRCRDRQSSLPIPFVLYVISRVLDALAYAHRKRGEDDRELNLVHRDVSPQNLLVSYEGEVKIIDFGLAKSTLSSAKTNPSIIMGKFLFMSPEQARHQRVDRRSDLYAVGLCLYELLFGHSPFESVPPSELMDAVANPSIRPLREVMPSCPASLSDLVAKALAVDPAQRFQTAEELRGRLVALLAELEPSFGPEMAAQLMREIFASEYQAERKMLASFRDRARTDGDETRDVTTESSAISARLTPLATREADDARDSRLPAPRRSPVRRRTGPREERETQPAIPIAEWLPPQGENAGKHDTPVEVVTSQLDVPHDAPAEASPGAAANPIAAPSPASADPAAVTVSSPPYIPPASRAPPNQLYGLSTPPRGPPRPRPARGAPAEPRSRVASRPSVAPVESEWGREDQDRASARSERRPPPESPGPGVLVSLVWPLLAVLAVAGYIVWDLSSDALKPKQLDPARGSAEGLRGERRPRDARVRERDDDLAALPGSARPAAAEVPQSPPPALAPPGPSPGLQAVRALRLDFERLPEDARKRFQLRMNRLEDDLEQHEAEPDFLSEVKSLDREIKAVLQKQPHELN
jgi:serine/threonine protein kinase